MQEATIHCLLRDCQVKELLQCDKRRVLNADVSGKYARFKQVQGGDTEVCATRDDTSAVSPTLVCKCLSAPLTWTQGEPPPSKSTLSVGVLHRSTLPSSDQLKLQPTNSTPFHFHIIRFSAFWRETCFCITASFIFITHILVKSL